MTAREPLTEERLNSILLHEDDFSFRDMFEVLRILGAETMDEAGAIVNERVRLAAEVSRLSAALQGAQEGHRAAVAAQVEALRERDRLRAELAARNEALRTLVEAADAYGAAVRIAGSYPGHEEYVEEEMLQIQGELDDADMTLAEQIDSARAALAASPVPPPCPECGDVTPNPDCDVCWRCVLGWPCAATRQGDR